MITDKESQNNFKLEKYGKVLMDKYYRITMYEKAYQDRYGNFS